MELWETCPAREEIAFLKNTHHLNEIWDAKLAYSLPAIFRSVYETFFEVRLFWTLPLRSQKNLISSKPEQFFKVWKVSRPV